MTIIDSSGGPFSTGLFEWQFSLAAGLDTGLQRFSNQDRLILCPDYGFFAVSDGMGGLRGGGETSEMIEKALPAFIAKAYLDLAEDPSEERAAGLLIGIARTISDQIFQNLNSQGSLAFGATLCAVWLVGHSAVFLNLGDSRGYHLGHREKRIRQVTSDHNVAGELVANGELSPEEARRHRSCSALTRFVGMPSPAIPETFFSRLGPGDSLLLSSDGLHGPVAGQRLPEIIRSSRSGRRVVGRLIGEANAVGGPDNICVVYVKIASGRSCLWEQWKMAGGGEDGRAAVG
ncbi:MAG: serine/threonine-protein phosphatase [Deltaproteobacteria bacterium]|jgi:protein phosphatase|nr:serine/threonine-protein phosphatase [Deltaproteobacteria bacterium]